MIFDYENLFSDAQNVSTSAPSNNVIDLGAVGKTWSGAQPVPDAGTAPMVIRIQLVADAIGTAPTLDVTLEADESARFLSATTVATATRITGGVAGDVVDIRYVPKASGERYLRLRYTVGGVNPTYRITAGIVMHHQDSDA